MSAREKAKKWVICSSAFVLAMTGLALSVDRSLAAIFVVPIFLLGFPCLLLSLIDLGLALRETQTDGLRASRAIWWLAQVQAVFGALCAAVGGFVVYATLASYATSEVPTPWLIVTSKVIVAAMLIVIGIHYIYDAFASRQKRASGDQSSH